MVKVFTYGSVVVQVLTRDEHAPPHVHVVSPDYSVELDISAPEVVVKPTSKNARTKNTPKFVKEAISQVTAHRQECKNIWKQYVNKGGFVDD
ncbi:DUF4160 domain-containing protein [cf. Phormidesmis sp. LEGE 11477]|uniref:DUF4160 domain-containing protein n=1 Tax=cf. Phormidesmis sp. LEGE 11477 TaxID=1828680 RepID=UPI00187E9009|nr:DUF4160 domain-containing protein [cf. Phormidesmis sp. LEGE 11477]MBE9061584.1 DUF4160 domain-containing protein [cf. Phormidesmis sp. LEGE 11477]